MKKGFSGCLVLFVQIFILLIIVGAISSSMGDGAGGLALVVGVIWLFFRKRQNKDLESTQDIKSLSTISFSYTDAEGNFTTRTVDVMYVDDVYIKGFCHKQNDSRTFRADRIVGDIVMNGQRYNVDDWLELNNSTVLSTSKPQITSSLNLEVCFAGFEKENKEILEQKAIDSGLTVCSSVTQNLKFLVIGPAIQHKIMKLAQEVNATLLSEFEFLEMIETGEIPQ
ncbi:WYL domain-containing protein [Pasteurella multocida]|uniref:WYL domain-containing protein n=1 Tax=Pasteurella multocida TaxID=747 RepID=UPI0029A9E3A8|nr:WYL domain-containing protein [Pasteurella multocida]MDX3952160.1 hypothetical protein [Pasteurella multocida]MDX3961220.1 hypothetical protein [Pasteurella multocida]HDR1413177.1 hypothetical protein [Pasteurella multocida]HDR1427021.1 hypothetical protein [Pasteurella multocida]